MSETIKDLIKKRGSIKGRLTLFTNYINSLSDLSEVTIEELELRIKRAEQCFGQFDVIQTNIECLTDPSDEIYSQGFNDRQEIEDQFYSIIAKAKQMYKTCLRKNNIENDDIDEVHSCISEGSSQSAGVVKQAKNSVKLPVIQIPHFSGEYENWLEFRDIFVSLIHENNTISNIQKFHYLRASLEGSAAQVIRSISFTSKNYDNAWHLLCDRYNNDNVLIHNHVKSLFSVETIKRESSMSIRAIIDAFSKNLRSLDTLGEPTSQWDTLIIYLINSKLDVKTSRDWEEHKTTLSKVTLSELMKFLKNKADLLETIHSNTSTNNYKPKPHNLKGLLNNNLDTLKCPLCHNPHKLFRCNIFLNQSINERIQSVRKLKLCRNCLKFGHQQSQCRSGPCPRCLNTKHNQLLCEAQAYSHPSIQSPITSTQHGNVEPPVDRATTLSVQTTEPVLLSTAVVYIRSSNNQYYQARAILDSGSQASFITKKLSHKLGLVCYNTETSITGLNNATVTNVTNRCDTIISSKVTSFKFNISLYVLPNITNLINGKTLVNKLHISSDIVLADPEYHNPSIDVDLLLGADVFWDLILTDQIRLGKKCPVLQQTQLGYIISGPTSGLKHKSFKQTETISCNLLQNEDIQDQLTKFWSLEETPYNEAKPALSPEENLCEQHFIENVKRMPDGRFSVAIPLKHSKDLLGESYNRALQCFLSLERRLQKQSTLKQMYIDFMREYRQLTHMSLVTTDSTSDTNLSYYLPHHGVLREGSSTTKLRAVFNASAATTSGTSFNDLQMVGPTIQSDLFSILIRFRHFTYVMTADIEKMYRQILVHEDQRNLQKIIWRDDPSAELQTFQLNTVTYGTASAPFLAVRCLKQLAIECKNSCISEIISKDFYVDDLVTGSQSRKDLLKIKENVSNILSQGCFNLRKFKSNVHDFNTSNFDTYTLNFDQHNSNTLGLGWIPSSDTLCFSHEPSSVNQPTKRSVLSTIGQIFDPLGLLAVFVVQAKIILQKLWLHKVSWDEPLPSDIAHQWNKFTSDLHLLKGLYLPRCSTCPNPDVIEIHTYCDSSQDAYGACVFLRSISKDGKIETRLLCAKSKVAPLKPVTIPRLELCGAVVGARLTHKVLQAFRLPVQKCILWSDSSVVLGWLKTNPSKLKVFVRNRVAEIQELTQSFQWRHISTHNNPADLITRGVDMSSIQNLDLWWSGPKYLHQPETQWPKTNIIHETLPEVAVHLTSAALAPETKQIVNISRFSSLNKLKRVLAYSLRFIINCKVQKTKKKLSGPLSTQELQNALNTLLKESQIASFPEYKRLQNKKHLPNKNSLLKLTPFLDEEGLIRVGGRLKNSNFDYDKKHPILLSSKHYLTKLIFSYEHIRLFHAPPQLLLSSIRQQYWPLGGRNMARQIVHKCQRCFRMRAQNINPIMGQLPEQRLNPGYPFQTTGVDYCGPLLAADRKGRGCKLIKVYIAVFVCFTTKAIHLELVSDLTKEAYIAALRRFVARRSKPLTIISDQGTQFKGAKNEIYSFLKQQKSQLEGCMANEGISFKYIPAYTPHFGGIWESAVKSVKYHLLRILGNARLTFEELYTTLTQIEAILNSRPLYPMSPDPNDLNPLTPGHFLVGRPLTAIPTPNQNSELNRLTRWERTEQLRQNFWNRWHKEYVAELQQKTKWRSSKGNLRVGEMVLIKDETLPPMKWSLGRILKVYEGVDGVGRVADIQTTRGPIRRAFNKICPLPSNSVEI